MSQQNEDYNPFQSPAVAFSDGDVADSNVEAVRREYLSHEASVQSVGLLYFLGGFLVLVASIGVLMLPQNSSATTGKAFIAYLLPVLAIVQLFTGYGLRKLQGWARLTTGLISGVGLLAFPVGTLINLYILYLIFSPKGRMVFSDDYRIVIDQTPHIKYKTSIVVWILLIILLTLIALGIGAVLLG